MTEKRNKKFEPFIASMDWVLENGDAIRAQYKGNFIAVADKQVIASAPTQEELRLKLAEANQKERLAHRPIVIIVIDMTKEPKTEYVGF